MQLIITIDHNGAFGW